MKSFYKILTSKTFILFLFLLIQTNSKLFTSIPNFVKNGENSQTIDLEDHVEKKISIDSKKEIIVKIKGELKDYIQISMISDQPIDAFVSKKKVTYSSQNAISYSTTNRHKNNTLILPKNEIKDEEKFYIGIISKSKTTEVNNFNVSLYFYIQDGISFDKDSDYFLLTNPNITKKLNFTYTPKTESASEKISFYIIPEINSKPYAILTLFDKSSQTILPVSGSELTKGLIALVDLSKYSISDTFYFNLKMDVTKNQLYRIGLTTVSDVQPIYPGMYEKIGYINSTVSRKICYEFKTNFNYNDNDEYIIEIFTGGYDLLFNINSQNYEITYQQSIKSTLSSGQQLCFDAKNENTYIAYSIQIVPYSSKSNYNFIDLQSNGFYYTHYLNVKQIQYYRRIKSSSADPTEINFNVREIVGHVNVYYIECEDFPNCNFTHSDLVSKSEVKPKGINGLYTIGVENDDKYRSWDTTQKLMYVECSEDTTKIGENGCEFSVSFFGSDDQMHLLPNTNLEQVMKINELDKYTFTIQNESNIKKIICTLNTISGDSSLVIVNTSSITQKKISAGSTDIVEFTKVEPSETFVGFYVVHVKANRGNYYSISYAIITEDSIYQINSGVAYLQTLKAQESKQFKIIDHHKNKKGFFVNFRTENCKIDVYYKNQLLNYNDTFLQHYPPLNNDEEILYKVVFNSFDHGKDPEYNNEICMFYLSSAAIADTTTLLLNEGNAFEFRLDKTLQKIRFLFPKLPDFNNLVSFLKVEEDEIISYVPYINEDESVGYNLSRSQIIEEYEPFIRDHCNETEICPLAYEIERYNKNSSNDINIEITIKESVSNVPSYLKKMQNRQEIVTNANVTYFFTDVMQDEAGEITLHFNRGSGKVIARIVEKGHSDKDPDWAGRIKLPKEGDRGVINTFDPYTRTLSYFSDATKNCTYGCDMYLSVISNDEYETYYSRVNDFYIYNRIETSKENPCFIEAQINTYIFGALEGIIDEDFYDYFTIILPVDGESMYFELQCKPCKLFVTIDDTTPTEKNNKFTIGGMGNTAKFIYKKDLDVQTLSELKLKIAVGTRQFDSVNTSPYNFKVNVIKQGFPNMIELSSNQMSTCQISEKNANYCDFILTAKAEENINNIGIFAQSDDPKSKLVIYVRRMDATNYLYFDGSEREKARPRADNTSSYETSSQNQIYTDNLLVFFSSTLVEAYLLISVHSSLESLITLSVTQSMEHIKKMMIIPTSQQLFHLSYDEELNLTIPVIDKYWVHINKLSGTGKLSFGTQNVEFKKNRDMISLIHYQELGDLVFKSTDNEEELLFTVFIDAKIESNNFDLFDFGSFGKLHYSIQQEIFPAMIYSKIPQRNDDQEIVPIDVNFHFTKLIRDDTSKELYESFVIKGAVLNESEILRRKFDYGEEVPTTVDGIFDEGSKFGNIKFKKEDITSLKTNENKYIYVSIKKGKDNFNKYNSALSDISISEETTVIDIPYGKYINDHLLLGKKEPNVYRLLKKMKHEFVIRLEFSANSKKINYALLTSVSGNVDYYTNSTELKINSVSLDKGKGIVVITHKTEYEKDEIYLSVFSTEKNHEVKNEELSHFVFRYESSSEDTDFIYYKKEGKQSIIKQGLTNEKLSLKIEYLKTLEGEVVKGMYIIKLFEESKIKTLSNLDSLNSITLFPIEPYIEREEKVGVESVNDDYLSTEIKKYPRESKFYVVVSILTENNEVFNYKYMLVGGGGSSKGISKSVLAVIIVLCFILVIIGLLALYYFYLHKKKKRDVVEEYNTSFAPTIRSGGLADASEFYEGEF